MNEQAWDRMKAKVVAALGATFESFNVEDYSTGLSNERVFRVSGYVMYSEHARELAKAKP